MAKRLQIAEDRLAKVTGYRVRVTETSGSQLRRVLPNTNPWQGMDCKRQECYTCNQGGEKLENCKKRNILYESSCVLCNPEVTAKQSKKKKLSNCQGVYVGETGRSIFERAGEHLRDAQGKQEDSHMIKHWLTDHSELETPPKFKIKVIGSFRDALSRQLSEAVRIDLRGGGVLNSKTEYSRCRVPRLVVDMEEWIKKKVEEKKELEQIPEEVTIQQEDIDIEQSQVVEMAAPTYESKRKQQAGGPKSKRRKLEPLINWGEDAENDIWEEWLASKEQVSRNRNKEWFNAENENVPSSKLKQLELNFAKILDNKNVSEEDTPKGVVPETPIIEQEGTEAPEIETEVDNDSKELEEQTISVLEISATQDQNCQPQPQNCQPQQQYCQPQPKDCANKISTNVPTTKPGSGSPYVRRTGKMTKKEKKEIASKNTKVTSWVSKRSVQVQPVQEQDMDIELGMEWEVTPDVDRSWRIMLAKSKQDEYHRLQGVKMMVNEMVTDMVNSCEPASVVAGIIESIMYNSYVEGEANIVWSKMEANNDIRKRIEMKMLEEEEEIKILLEVQARAERKMMQEEAKSRWLSLREEKIMKELAISLNIMTVRDIPTELDDDQDEDGDIKMKLEETEAEIDAWLEKQTEIAEKQIIRNVTRLEAENMEFEEEIQDMDILDDNNTRIANPEASYEEWLVQELNKFNIGAVTKLKVGLISSQNYNNGGTWFMNRWITPLNCQPQGTTQSRNCQPKAKKDPVCNFDNLDIKSCLNNRAENINIKHYPSVIREITAGNKSNCILSRPRKRRRAPTSSTRWSRGTWLGTSSMGSCAAVNGSDGYDRIVMRGRRRITSSSHTGLPTTKSKTSITTLPIALSLSISVTTIPIHTPMENSDGQGDQTVIVAAVQKHGHGQGQGGRDQDHDDGAQVGDDQQEELPQHAVDEAQVRGQPSRDSRPRKDFRVVKKRGIIPDGLVRRRLDSFIIAFPNLRGGGESLNRKEGVGMKRKNGT